jgi:UPF0042 nucleotide-binding protein
MRFIVLTGTSGAGKSTAFNFFEDIGYRAVDNVPPRLLPELARACHEDGLDKVRAVVDSRAGESIRLLPDMLEEVERQGIKAELVFLDASDESLIRRFKETRRPHPTFRTESGAVLDAIQAERKLLTDILARADKTIDTSNMTPQELRKELASVTDSAAGPGLTITIVSFGFKHGIPIDADLIFDVRFLVNPHYVPALKPLTGVSPEVAHYIHRDPLTEPFLEKLVDFVDFTLPQYAREGKAYLTIGIGCTGGRHRSVTIAEDLAASLRSEGFRVTVFHRDSHRDPSADPGALDRHLQAPYPTQRPNDPTTQRPQAPRPRNLK